MEDSLLVHSAACKYVPGQQSHQFSCFCLCLVAMYVHVVSQELGLFARGVRGGGDCLQVGGILAPVICSDVLLKSVACVMW